MSDEAEARTTGQSVLRGSARVLTGLALSALGAVLFVNIGVTEINPVTRDVPVFTVDTEHASRHTAVCSGHFQLLGSDPSQPDRSTTIGGASVTTNVPFDEVSTVDDGVWFATQGDEVATGGEQQHIDESTASGLVAAVCSAPLNESWIVAGTTARGTSGTVVLSNPSEVPSTVRLTVHDESGELSDTSSTGVLVPAHSQRTVSLNGFGAGKLSPVVHVLSNGAPIAATLALSELRDIVPTGASTVNAQAAPSETLVFPGVMNFVDHSHHDHGDDAPDEFPAVVRLFLPTSVEGGPAFAHASLQAVMPNGSRTALAETHLTAGEATDVVIERLPDEALAVIVTSDAPVVGGLYSSVHNNNDHDFTWMTPSTVFDPGEIVDTVVVPRGSLTLVNLGEAEGTFDIQSVPSEQSDMGVAAEADSIEVSIAAGAAAQRMPGAVTRITGDQPFAMGVTITDQRELATYPILGAPLGIGELTVYTR